jgi:hypothetical protein
MLSQLKGARVLTFSRKQKRQNSCKEFGFLRLFWISFWDARSDSRFLGYHNSYQKAAQLFFMFFLHCAYFRK